MRPARKSSSTPVAKADPSLNRWQRIARRAYELAKRRGFTPGAELSDWLQAEKEIDTAEQEKLSAPENQMTG
jgi:16S rRNA U1498 N3-methylase RsmE